MVGKKCRCGEWWLSVNDCVCKTAPKARQRRPVTRGTRKAERSRADDHRGETQQTKITRPTRHFSLEEGRVRKVPGWNRKS